MYFCVFVTWLKWPLKPWKHCESKISPRLSSPSREAFFSHIWDRVHVVHSHVRVIEYVHTRTHVCACVYRDLNISTGVFVRLQLFCLCVCVLPNNGSSLPSAWRCSEDSRVHFRSSGRSEVRLWCRWPLVLGPPSRSGQINRRALSSDDMPPSRSLFLLSISLSLCLSLCFNFFRLTTATCTTCLFDNPFLHLRVFSQRSSSCERLLIQIFPL